MNLVTLVYIFTATTSPPVGENFVTITDGGYQSRTTKSRLNAILREHCVEGESVYQKRGEWFVTTFLGKDDKVTHIPFCGSFTFK